MKKNIHPPYQEVLFVDSSTGYQFVCGSTIQPKEKGTFEGKEYPKVKVEISSKSHPIFTGEHKFVDTAGRIDRFRERYKKGSKKPEEKAGQDKSEDEKEPKKKKS